MRFSNSFGYAIKRRDALGRLVPKDNLALLIDPGVQMIENTEPNKPYRPLMLGSENISNSNFTDFTIDYPSVGEATPFYESDFSVDEDGWAVVAGTVIGNIDGVGGQDDALKFWCDSSTSDHGAVKPYIITEIGQYYKVTGKIYIPSTNTNVKRVRVNNGWGVDGYIDIDTQDSWVNFTLEINNTHSNGGVRFTPYDSTGSALFAGAGVDTDDIFYVKDIKVQRVGLVAWWQFDDYYHSNEGTGKTIFQDLSGNGYDLTPSIGFDYTNQMTGSDPTYKNGNSLEFDGVDDFAYRPAADATAFNPGTGNFSFSCWIRTDNNTDVLRLFDKTGTAQIAGCLVGNNSIRIDVKDNAGNLFYYVWNKIYADNVWHNLVFVFDRINNIVSLFFDGSLFISIAISSLSSGVDPTGDFNVGVYHVGTTFANFFDGFYETAAYFNRALSSTEVKALYAKPKNWSWNETGTLQNSNFNAVLSGGAGLSQDITVDDNTLYKEQKLGIGANQVDYFGNTTSHTITIGDGTWTYAGIKDVMNVDAVGSNFVEDFSRGGAVYSDELVTNGDTENGEQTVFGTSIYDTRCTHTRTTDIAHYGSYSIKVVSDGTIGNNFYNRFNTPSGALEVGAYYKSVAWVYFPSGQNSAFTEIKLIAKTNGIEYVLASTAKKDQWVKLEGVFKAQTQGVGDFILAVRGVNTGDGTEYFYWDDISFKKVFNGSHGIAYGGLELSQPVFPYAWEFDKTDDYIDFGNINDIINTSAIFPFWFKTSNTSQCIMSKYNGAAGYSIEISSTGRLSVTVSDGTTILTTIDDGDIVNDNIWHMGIIVIDRNNNLLKRYYFDSSGLINTGTNLDISSITTFSTTANFFIGARNLSTIDYYYGGMLSLIPPYLFDGQNGRDSIMPNNYQEHYINRIYNNTKRYFTT